MTETPINSSRRQFLKLSAAVGGGLLLGIELSGQSRNATAATTASDGEFSPSAWLRIGSDNRVTFLLDRSEMGQGVMTALPMLVAEELEISLSQLHVEFAPADPAFINPLIGSQLTGGSTSVRAAWERLRSAGAVARNLLISAAAQRWGVAEAECRANNSMVLHEASGQRASYGDLAAAAAKLPVPALDAVFLKEPEEFRLIGKPLPRLDTPAKVTGSAIFASDVRLDGMLIASVERCPVFGGKLKRVDGSKTRDIKGVKAVQEISGGVAVVATDTWAALQGRKVLNIEWDEGPNSQLSSTEIERRLAQAAESGQTAVARSAGDLKQAKSQAAQTIEAVYNVPYQAHAPMEPLCCVADVRADRCELWVGTQAQTKTQQVAADITGLPLAQVKVNTTFLGGGFGRRGETDFVADAVELSKLMGVPVKVQWTREDEIQHGFYRPVSHHRLSGMLDKDGNILGWEHRIVSPSIMQRVFPGAVRDGLDNTSVEGAANLPYGVPNLRVDYVIEDPGVPVGFWRSVGSSQNAFVSECFFDELAVAAWRDPLELRLSLLRDSPRHYRVLELAAEKAGWGKTHGFGRAMGLAVAESFGSYCAQVAEVSVSDQGFVRLHRVVCAIDCGQVVNPDTVKAQMESSIVFGLTATLHSAINIVRGRVAQSNFIDFPLLRFDEMPEVEVHIVPSKEFPGGVGEPGTPPIAPAVANAVFAATGKRIRHLPILVADLQNS